MREQLTISNTDPVSVPVVKHGAISNIISTPHIDYNITAFKVGMCPATTHSSAMGYVQLCKI